MYVTTQSVFSVLSSVSENLGENHKVVSFNKTKQSFDHSYSGAGLWSRKSRHPTPTPGNFDYPTPTPTPDQLRPSPVLVTQSDNSFQMNS